MLSHLTNVALVVVVFHARTRERCMCLVKGRTLAPLRSTLTVLFALYMKTSRIGLERLVTDLCRLVSRLHHAVLAVYAHRTALSALAGVRLGNSTVEYLQLCPSFVLG